MIIIIIKNNIFPQIFYIEKVPSAGGPAPIVARSGLSNGYVAPATLPKKSDVVTEATVTDTDLSTLALIAIGTGVISVICGITLMLFLYKKKQNVPTTQNQMVQKYTRDHTPISRHSSVSKMIDRKVPPPPRDFMDKKDVEMVRTLSRAPAQG